MITATTSRSNARRRLGEFNITSLLGKGGMATVWRAEHVHTGSPVAIKIIAPQHADKPRFREAFRDEVRALALLDHPAIIQIFDYGDFSQDSDAMMGGCAFLAMSLIEGETLSARCGRVAWPEIKRVLLKLLQALAHAHARGITHRDIKPSNVLLDQNDGVFLTDFGIAHLGTDDPTGLTTRSCGTPAYMAPEQIEGRWRDQAPWTDLYALGCLAHALVCGASPFESLGDTDAICQAHLYKPPPLSLSQHSAPAGLEAWITHALQKDPRRRFVCAADAARALEQIDAERITGLNITLNDTTSPDAPQWKVGASGGTATLPSLDTLSSSVERRAPTLEDLTMDFQSSPWSSQWQHERRPEAWDTRTTASLRLFGLRALPMVDRDTERDALWRALGDAITRQQPTGVMLTGDIGVGKSRLAQWLCHQAHERGSAQILFARHSATGGLDEGLAAMLRREMRLEGLQRADAVNRIAAYLSPLGVRSSTTVDALAEFACGPQGDSPSFSPKARWSTLTYFLERLAQRRAVLIWLDDLQWGAETQKFMVQLLGSARETRTPLLAVMTCRTDAETLEHLQSSPLFAKLNALPEVHEIPVGPLPETARPEFLSGVLALNDALAARVEARTAGNPLFAIQLLSDWVQRDLLEPGQEGLQLRHGAPLSLPDDLHSVWRERVVQLLSGHGRDARWALFLAGLLGQEVDMASWQALCDVLDLPLPHTLFENLLDQGLARRSPQGFFFTHVLLPESLERVAFEEGIGVTLHRACAIYFQERGAPSQAHRLALHLLKAGDELGAVAPLALAARAFLNGGNARLSADLLQKRDDILSRQGPRAEPWWEGQLLWSQVHRALDRPEDAQQAALACFETARRRQWHGILCGAAMALGRVAFFQNQGDEAIEMFETCIEAAAVCGPDDAQAQEDAASARLLKGAHHRNQREFALARQEVLTSLSIFTASQDPSGQAAAIRGLAQIAYFSGELDEAHTLARRAWRLCVKHQLHLERSGCLNMLGEVARARGQHRAARQSYEEARDIFKALGRKATVYEYNIALTMIEERLYEEALHQSELCVTLLTQQKRSDLLANIACVLMACCAGLGDWERFDIHQAEVNAFTLTSSLDVARIVQHAAALAAEAGWPSRARVTYEMAIELWQGLGEASRVAAIEAAIESL